MKINTKTTIKNLKGEVIKLDNVDFTIGHAISEILIATKDGGKMKLFNLAQKLFDEDVVDVDDADLQIIKQAVEKTELYNNLVNGQILIILNENKS